MGYLKTIQHIPVSIDRAWDFFSSPGNLKDITPPYMGFDITSANRDQKIYPGMIITYKVRPLLRLPLNWMTEITQVKEKQYFIDEQISGPYKIWHHEHHFEESDNGVVMTDILHYKLPFGPAGRLIEKMLVKNRVGDIFEFRRKKLESLFPVAD